MYMQNTCSAHGPFFPQHQGDRCPLCKIGEERKQAEQRLVEEVLATFEHWLRQSMFEQADELLLNLKIDLPPAVLIAALSITFHAKDTLKHREAFLARVETKLKTELGNVRAEELLRTRR